MIKKNPLHGKIASVSVGIYKGAPVLDLDYDEDSSAETDMNVVMNDAMAFIEIQGTAEGHAFRADELNAMLELANVGAGDHVIDLGSGDGRIVITAAKRFGATGLGVEIVPELVARSIENARLAGVDGKVRFLEQDLFKADLSPATVVTMYLLPEVNLRLRPSLLALKPGTRIVSHDWDMGDWKILSTDEYGYGSDFDSDREFGEPVRIVKFSV